MGAYRDYNFAHLDDGSTLDETVNGLDVLRDGLHQCDDDGIHVLSSDMFNPHEFILADGLVTKRLHQDPELFADHLQALETLLEGRSWYFTKNTLLFFKGDMPTPEKPNRLQALFDYCFTNREHMISHNPEKTTRPAIDMNSEYGVTAGMYVERLSLKMPRRMKEDVKAMLGLGFVQELPVYYFSFGAGSCHALNDAREIVEESILDGEDLAEVFDKDTEERLLARHCVYAPNPKYLVRDRFRDMLGE